MKKSDPATGMIIDVPESMAYKSKFPYPGFWTGAYPILLEALMTHTSLSRKNKSLVNQSLNASLEMLNGEYAIFLTEKMWSIGELMNLNPLLPIVGNTGSLGYIKPGPDGGRMEVAAKLFEPAISAMLNQASGISNSKNNMAMFSNEFNSLRATQLKLNTRLAELEATTPRETEVITQEQYCHQQKRIMSVLADEMGDIKLKLDSLVGASDEKLRVESEFKQLQSNVGVIQRKIASGSDTQSDRLQLGKLKKRMENLGLALQRGQYGGNPSLQRDYTNLYSYKEKEYLRAESELNQCTQNAIQMRNAYQDGVREGQQIWNTIKELTLQIESSQMSIDNAKASVSMFSNEDTRNLVKIWLAHLSDAKSSLEGGLFKAKYEATVALTSSPRAMLAESLAIDPSVIRDYEDYNSAVTDIADGVEDSEYDVLEQIGRLGLSMMYVPGAARILAIGDMRQKDRYKAYRNLIEEILSQGQRLSADDAKELSKLMIGDYSITFQSTDELKEVKELLRHLADSRLNFKYGGGN